MEEKMNIIVKSDDLQMMHIRHLAYCLGTQAIKAVLMHENLLRKGPRDPLELTEHFSVN